MNSLEVAASNYDEDTIIILLIRCFMQCQPLLMIFFEQKI